MTTRVKIVVYTDITDDKGSILNPVESWVVLEDDHQIHASDLVATYDMMRHNMMVQLDKEGLKPTWDYPQMYGKS